MSNREFNSIVFSSYDFGHLRFVITVLVNLTVPNHFVLMRKLDADENFFVRNSATTINTIQSDHRVNHFS